MTIHTIITKLDYSQLQSLNFYAKELKKLKYILYFNEHLECEKRMERKWNAIARIKLIKHHSHA